MFVVAHTNFNTEFEQKIIKASPESLREELRDTNEFMTYLHNVNISPNILITLLKKLDKNFVVDKLGDKLGSVMQLLIWIQPKSERLYFAQWWKELYLKKINDNDYEYGFYQCTYILNRLLPEHASELLKQLGEAFITTLFKKATTLEGARDCLSYFPDNEKKPRLHQLGIERMFATIANITNFLTYYHGDKKKQAVEQIGFEHIALKMTELKHVSDFLEYCTDDEKHQRLQQIGLERILAWIESATKESINCFFNVIPADKQLFFLQHMSNEAMQKWLCNQETFAWCLIRMKTNEARKIVFQRTEITRIKELITDPVSFLKLLIKEVREISWLPVIIWHELVPKKQLLQEILEVLATPTERFTLLQTIDPNYLKTIIFSEDDVDQVLGQVHRNAIASFANKVAKTKSVSALSDEVQNTANSSMLTL